MKFHWLKDKKKDLRVYWGRGPENKADFFTKHHSPKHFRNMRKHYIINSVLQYFKSNSKNSILHNSKNSILHTVKKVLTHSGLRGCADTSYLIPRITKNSNPRIPRILSSSDSDPISTSFSKIT